MIREFAIHFVSALLAFLACEIVWLGFVARDFYFSKLDFLLADSPNWYAAAAFYVVFVTGLTLFVVTPAVRRGSLLAGVAWGSFFGIVTYATYDLTNLATVEGWPLSVTMVDIAWGGTISAIATWASVSSGIRFAAKR